jgi:hypothetical protein
MPAARPSAQRQSSEATTPRKEYVAANTPIIREQLQKAGVRLAHLLDAALGK